MKLALSGNEPRQAYLFATLRKLASVIGEFSFDNIDPLTKYLAAALSFATPREEWWGNYQMHPLVQRRRSRVLSDELSNLPRRPDRLLLWGSWFNPRMDKRYPPSLPFYNYIDQSRSLEPLAEERRARFTRRRRSYELQQIAYDDSSGIFCMSEWCRVQTLEAHPQLDETKVLTVGWGPCTVDLSAEDIDEGGREPIVLHVSNDFYRKGIDYLVETASIVTDQIPDAKFLVIGRDASQLNTADSPHVKFIGPVYERSELSEYFRRSSVFFLPHRFDRSPHVLAEAMSAKLPIVTSAQGGPMEVAEGTGAGYAHTIGNIEGYANSIIRLLNDRELRSRMGEAGKDLMMEKYNWSVVAQNMLKAMSDDQ